MNVEHDMMEGANRIAANDIAGETLQQRTTRLRNALKDAQTGPLLVAQEVVQIAKDWSRWEAETGGMTATAWCRHTFGKGRTLAFFKRRASAVDRIGPDARRELNHDVAVWLAGQVPQEALKIVKSALHTAFIENSRNPLTMSQTRDVVEGIIGACTRLRTCSNCERLKTENRNLRATIKELQAVAKK